LPRQARHQAQKSRYNRRQAQLIDGLILSGGHDVSPYNYGQEPSQKLGETFPERDTYEMILLEESKKRNIPILGICYGMQAIAQVLDGKVERNEVQETGECFINCDTSSKIFSTVLGDGSFYLMNHVDCVTKLPEGFKSIAHTCTTENAAMMNEEKNIYGVQFHPEVEIRFGNRDTIENFLYKICKAEKTWRKTSFISKAGASSAIPAIFGAKS